MLLIIVLHGYTLICIVMQNKYAKRSFNNRFYFSERAKIYAYKIQILWTVFNEEAYKLIY